MTRASIFLDHHGSRLYLSEVDGRIQVTIEVGDEQATTSLDRDDVDLIREWLASPDAALDSDGVRFPNAFERRVEKYNQAMRRALGRD